MADTPIPSAEPESEKESADGPLLPDIDSHLAMDADDPESLGYQPYRSLDRPSILQTLKAQLKQRKQRMQQENTRPRGPSLDSTLSGIDVVAWLLLLVPLAALTFKAATFDRSTWPTLVGDEAVYLMAAQSIAWDGDFLYSQQDQDRFVELTERTPDGLILQSPDQGRTLFYGKAWLYPLAIAPFVKAMPENGYALGNALYLTLAALLAAWVLRRPVGAWAPVFVACCVFASISFAHVFWAHPDLFLMCAVAIACALVLKPWFDDQRAVRLSLNLPRQGANQRNRASRTPLLQALGTYVCLALGSVLLVGVGLVRPAYLPLLLIPLISARTIRRSVFAALVVAGATYAIVEFNQRLTGVWSPYAGERQAFYGYTGFPQTTEQAENSSNDTATPHPAWKQAVEERGDTSWTGDGMFAFPFEPHQFAWNILYVFIGRNTGLFPYFLPFLLGLFAFRSDRVSWYLLLTTVAILGLFLIIRPFNYYGGGGALANRYFLPIFPLTWFLARRALSWRWPAVITAVALLTLLPKWINPGSFWRTSEGAFSYVSEVSERFLPHETTQSNLKPADREDINYQTPSGKALWIKPLSPRVASPDAGRTLTLRPGPNRAEVVAASETPIRAFRIEVEGQETRTARFSRPSARHRMWWSFDVLNLYQFDLEGGAFSVDRNRRVTITPIPRVN